MDRDAGLISMASVFPYTASSACSLLSRPPLIRALTHPHNRHRNLHHHHLRCRPCRVAAATHRTKGHVMEEWRFDFGFVIPGSTNSWQQVIEPTVAAPRHAAPRRSEPRHAGLHTSPWHTSPSILHHTIPHLLQQVIKAADEMMDPDLLTGNITIETSFFDGASFIAKSLVRIYYD